MAPARTVADLDPGSDDESPTLGLGSSTPAQDTKTGPDDDDEDDYMNMAIPEKPLKSCLPETSLQRRQRQKREAEARSRPLSKAELAAQEAAKREAALSTELDQTNKGFRMMAKLGFKAGDALGTGSSGEARTQPVMVEMKGDRGGVGADAEKKRKFREEADRVEGEVKRRRAEEGEFRERVRREAEEKRCEGLCVGAMNVCERLDEGGDEGGDDVVDGKSDEKKRRRGGRPLQSVPVLYRGLVRHRLEKEREKRMRQDLTNSLGRGLPTHNDPDEDDDYVRAFATEEVELEEEDPELEEYNALDASERLQKLVVYLREKHRYCFWCKAQYPDEEMDGCPGLTEEDHD